MAAFHAIPLALKLRKPEVFNEKVRPYLAPMQRNSAPHEEEHNAMLLEILQDSYKCIPWIPKVKEVFKNVKAACAAPPREPFSTVSHGDMWVNNTMIKFQRGLPVHNKLIDFQICDYTSPAMDLLFFLFTSVQLSVLQDDLDGLLEFYHLHFISHLENLKCDITPFSFPKFLEEMRAATTVEILHVISMVYFIVFGKKGGHSREVDHSKPPDFEKMKSNINLVAKEKVWYMIEACGKRGWLEPDV